MGQLKQALLCSSYSHDTYDTLLRAEDTQADWLAPEPDVGYMLEDALAEHLDQKLENRCEAQWQANNLMRSVE